MYFKQIQEIIDGTKTQTRRVVKPGEAYAFRYLGSTIEHVTDGRAAYNPQAPTSMITKVFTPSGRVKWQVGRDYAVSPGRGLPCALWRPGGFILTYSRDMTISAKEWTQAHINAAPDHPDGGWRPLRIVITAIRCEPLQNISEEDARAEGVNTLLRYDIDHLSGFESYVASYAQLWNSINTRKGLRWADNPRVWVLEFEVKR